MFIILAVSDLANAFKYITKLFSDLLDFRVGVFFLGSFDI